MPSVDVLIVSFNTRELLRDCLTSVYAHTPGEGIELRVSVFDNASTDGSPEMVAESFPAVRLVRSEDNLGFGAGNDRLAETSDADLLLLLNSDTILTEDVISPLADELLASEQIAIAAPRLEFPDGELQLSSLSFPTLRYELVRTFNGTPLQRFASTKTVERIEQVDLVDDRAARDTDFVWATCWLIRREDPDLQPIFDPAFPMYDEDLDTCRRLRDRGRRVRYVPSVTLIHLGGKSAPTRQRFQLAAAGRRRYFRRQHGALAAAAYAAMKAPGALAARVNRSG